MNWEAISAIAEIIGMLGVIASLVYVAIQVRQNSSFLKQNNLINRSAMVHETSVSYNQFPKMLADSAELSEIYIRGLNNEDLSPADTLRFESIVNICTTWLEDTGYQYQVGLYFDEEDETDLVDFMAPAYKRLLMSKVARNWWREDAVYIHTPSFYEKLSRIIRDWEDASNAGRNSQ